MARGHNVVGCYVTRYNARQFYLPWVQCSVRLNRSQGAVVRSPFSLNAADKSNLNHPLIHFVKNLSQILNYKHIAVCINVLFSLKNYIFVVS